MINGMYHEHLMYHGKELLVDIADLGGIYEVMVLDHGMDEIECFQSKNFDSAYDAYRRYILKYSGEPLVLNEKYAKIRDDIRRALDVGEAVEKENSEDGGTCNFDGTAVKLPVRKKAVVYQIAKECGVHCFEWKFCGERWWVFPPRTHGQGNARSRNASAVTYALEELGYDALDYCEMD